MADRVASSSGAGHDAAKLLPCTCHTLEEPYCPRHTPLPGESDLPVAAPDHAETLRRAEKVYRAAKTPDGFGHRPRWSQPDLAVFEALLTTADALLVERQQAGEALRLREAALASLDQILFGSSRIRSRDELEMRAQELVAERQQDKERRKTLWLALECAADILGNAGYADDPDYANDWHQITAALAVEEDAPPQDELDPDTRAALVEMADEMREAERLGPPYVECGCGYPKQPCLRVMLRNGPPYPDRPCVPVRAAVEEDAT